MGGCLQILLVPPQHYQSLDHVAPASLHRTHQLPRVLMFGMIGSFESN